MKKKTLKAARTAKPAIKRIVATELRTPEQAAEDKEIIAKVKEEFPPATPEHVKMMEERYKALAERVCLLRNDVATFIRGFVHGTETGYIHTPYYQKPAPKHIMHWSKVHVEKVIEDLNVALFQLEHLWLTDHPEAKLPDNITHEFKL